MPLSNSILNPQTVTKEQLAFDVSGSAGSDFIGGGGGGAGTQGPQGTQGIQGPQGTQGTQGNQGAFFIGAQGSQGQSVYIGPTANLASTPNVVYSNSAGNDQVFIGQQGSVANFAPLVIQSNDQQSNATSTTLSLRHNTSNASNGIAGIGTSIAFASKFGATENVNIGSLKGIHTSSTNRYFELETIGISGRNAFLRSTPYLSEQIRIPLTTSVTGASEISKKILLTQDGSSPTNGFGAIETIQLQTNAGSTPQNVAHHKYTLTTAAEASRKSQYTLTVYDKTLNSTTPDFDIIDGEPRQTIFTAWSNTLSTRTTGFVFNTDAAVAGTPSGSFGTILELQAKSDTTANRQLATIEGGWTTFTDANRTSNLTLKVARNGTLGKGITLTTSEFGQGFSSLSSFSTGTNSGLVLSPKGTGYFKAGTEPDGTSTNGTSPGNYAVDLMLGSKSNSAQVAGGQFSSLIGGTTSQIGTSNTYGAILGGQANVLGGTATHSAILGGYSNQIVSSATHGAVLGGRFNYVDGANAVALGGDNNFASHTNSVIIGKTGQTRTENSLSISGGTFASIFGDAMSFQTVLRGQTTNTVAPLSLANDGTAFYAHQDNTSIVWDINVIGRVATGDTCSYHLRASTKRNAGGNVQFIGAIDSLERENNAAWNADLVIDTTNLRVQVTGTAFQTIRWVAHVRATMVTF